MSGPQGAGTKEVLTLAIAKMMRVFMVGASAHREETLRFLQRAGVVHLEPAAPLSGESEKQASAALLNLRRLGQIEQAVGRYRSLKETAPVECSDAELAERAEGQLNALQECRNRRQALERLENDLAPWGDFDPDRIRLLEANGVQVRRWRMERKKATDLNVPEGVYAEVVSEKQGLQFYTVSLGAAPDIAGATPLPLPEMRLAEVSREIGRLAGQEKQLASSLAGIAQRADVLKGQVTDALNEARYLETMGTLYAETYLFGLQGWVPAAGAEGLLKAVGAEGLPLQVEIREPLEEEEPPILYENNWFIRRIEPLQKLYGNPKYRELDPSYFFAPFMILFFGICYGDAGYGVIMYIASHYMEKKWGEQVEGLPLVAKLCKAFAVSTIFVGIVTGSIFGLNFENREWILIDIAVGVGDPMLFFYIALGLGVLHLSFSYLLGMMQAGTWTQRFPKLGLMCVLWGGVMLVVKNVWFATPAATAGPTLETAGYALVILGLLLTLLFSSDHRNWGIRLGLGLWSIYGLTGLVGDLLSYARLFGLGIATSAIASVMNQLAGMVYGVAGPVLGIPLALIILILGHTFNLALGILGSTVHSARLHFVEAFKSFFEGGGVEYKPFKIERGSL
jgi:V/A-type H+-transporting ATPase subunit I